MTDEDNSRQLPPKELRPADPLDPKPAGMEVNNHFGPHLPHKDLPTPEQLMYLHHTVPVGVNISEADLQAQILNIEKYYRIQEESLVQQFESQRRLLATEHQVKMQEQIKLLMLQKQQQELYEHQQKLQEQRLQQERMEKEKLEQIKHKNKDEESAVASTEVKLKLRECLLNKGQRDPGLLKNSPPDYRQWATHHSSLEQHSPPTNGRSPPLRAAHLLGRFEDQYPLRKTVSEPNLKMRSRISLRQKVMHRSPLVLRRDLMAKKMMVSTSSEPNLKVRLALKQKMIERRSTTLLRRKERFTLNAKRNTTPLTIDTNSPDSSPSSPHSGSQGSQGSVGGEVHTPQKESQDGATTFPLQMMSKMVINQSMPNISIGQPRDTSAAEANVATNLSASASEAELRARAAAQHGLPLTQHMLSGTIPMYPSLLEMSPTNPAYIDAQMKAMELARTSGQIPLSPTAMPGGPGFHFGITDAQAAKARLHRQTLNRTQSAPLPLPGHLVWNQHLMHQKQQELLMKETQKLHMKHRLQTALLQKSASKGHMENVDEEAEAKLVQEMKAIKEKEDEDVVIVSDPASAMSTSHEAFLRKLKQQTSDSLGNGNGSSIPGRTLERAMSSPLVTAGHHMPSLIPHEASAEKTFMTGLAYDSLMLKHQCMCGNNDMHPEHPGRLQSIYARIQETGLASKCQKLQCHKASLEELQTCHSEAYTLMYGTSPQKLSPKLFEVLQPRFRKLACGGIGVDSDTVWNDAQTPQATRMAVGCVIELATNIATGRLENGLALVRPPGHHAEPTQPMGFCYFNSLAVATKILLDRHKMKKILVIDWDVHHGNSTQQIFYADPRVLYISVHRHDNGNFFPGTGAPDECGIDKGLGFNVNIAFSGALKPPMGDAEYVAAFRTIVMPIAREFDPEIVLVSAGFDAASGHPPPLGGYEVSPACFGHMTKQMMTLANGKVGMALEGGYELQAICDSTEMCLRALLGEEMPLLREDEMCRPPCRIAVDALEQTIRNHMTYWPCLARYRDTLDWSIVEAQQREREEVDTVNAFASLSVVPEKSPEMISQQSDYGTAEAMEES